MGAECKKHGSAVTNHINQHISLLSETAIDQFRDRFQSFLFVRSLTDQFDLISALYTCPQHAQYTFCISCCVSIFKFDRTLKPQGVKVVTTGAGNPAKYMKMWKEAGIIVIPVVASVALAKLMERGGADAVVAEGTESGGHIGEATTMTLVPQVVDAVSIPVIAAGGIGDGRGIAAAFMLGAEAVQMGTRFVVAKESIVHENYKQRIIKAKDIDSAVTGRTHGHPVRCLRNQMTREYNRLEAEGKSFEELEYLTLGTLRKAVQEGDTTNGTVMAGQIAGLVTKEQTCKEMIDEMMEQSDKLLGGCQK